MLMLVCAIVGLGAGVFVEDKIPLAVLGAMILVLAIVARVRAGKIRLAAGMLLIFCLMLARTAFLPHRPTALDIDFYNNNAEKAPPVAVRATVCAEPDVRHRQTKYTLCVTELQLEQDGDRQEVCGKIMLSHRRWPEYNYGDELVVTGALRAPFQSADFDYQKYLRMFGIYSEMRRANAEKIGNHEPNWLLARIFDLKNYYAGVINKVFPEPQAAFLDGLLRGARKGLPEQIYNEFQRTGLTHIIAVSGFNITIVAATMMTIFGRISYRFGAVATIAGIIFFVIFTGMSAAVIRAGIMGGIAALAMITGRQADATLALLLAAVLMTLWQPLTLFADVGFQLSFLATAGLIFVSPFLEKITEWIPNFLGLKEAFLLTISAQITVVPLIAFHFGRLSLISPVANVLVAPFIVMSMGLGFVAIIGGMAAVPLGIWLGIPAYGTLSAILGIAHLGAAVPLADIELRVGLPAMVSYYALLMILLIYLWHRSPRENF